MANTYSKIVYHIILGVRFRQALITPDLKTELETYFCGLFLKWNLRVITIYCNPDHVHILVTFRPSLNLDKVMKEVKVATTLFIRTKKPLGTPFRWQSGYRAFSCYSAWLGGIVWYIENQEAHHRKKSFRQEDIEMLRENEVEFDERYVFKELE
jgi:putative transposase